MNKKVLDGAVTLLFCMSLIVTSSIQEKDTGEPQRELERNTTVTAGVSSVLSGYSFTTESDEKTVVEKREIVRVASPAEMLQAEVIAGKDKTHTEEESTEAWKSAEPVGNRWGITLTEEEMELLARIVWLESNGEPVEGQGAVVEVVFNRMASDLFPDTLYDVLSQRNPVQFSSWKNRGIAKPTDKEYQSIRQVLNGNTGILRNDTIYFSTKALTPRLDKRIGGHSFCY